MVKDIKEIFEKILKEMVDNKTEMDKILKYFFADNYNEPNNWNYKTGGKLPMPEDLQSCLNLPAWVGDFSNVKGKIMLVGQKPGGTDLNLRTCYDFAIEDDPYRELINKIGIKKKEYRWCDWVNPEMISQQKDYKQFQGSRLWSYLRELVEGKENNESVLFDDFKKNLYVTDQFKIKLEKRKVKSKIKSDEKKLNKEKKSDEKELNKKVRKIINKNRELMNNILKDELELIQPQLIILMGNPLLHVLEEYSSITTIIPHEANFDHIIDSYQSDIPPHFNIFANFSAEICDCIRNRTELIKKIKSALLQ